jgi:glucose-1-phosphate thymidylyltransferase
MIYYPLSTLMLAGVWGILIISTPEDTPRFEQLLGDGKALGIKIEYEIQHSPDGLAQAFLIGERFIGDDNVALVLGDNIFYGHGFTKLLEKAVSREEGATVFGYNIKDPERFGVVEFNQVGKAISIEEKSKYPKSTYAVTGLYFYDNRVVEIAKTSNRQIEENLKLQIVNKAYLELDDLNVELLGRGFASEKIADILEKMSS